MPTYLSPGVYVEELEAGSRPIEGVGTAVAAFVGLAEKGPFNTPTLVTNWSQYVQNFGEMVEGIGRLRCDLRLPANDQQNRCEVGGYAWRIASTSFRRCRWFHQQRRPRGPEEERRRCGNSRTGRRGGRPLLRRCEGNL